MARLTQKQATMLGMHWIAGTEYRKIPRGCVVRISGNTLVFKGDKVCSYSPFFGHVTGIMYHYQVDWEDFHSEQE